MDPSDFASAYALSTTAGVRPFVTLALASLALHFGWIHLAHAYAGLGTDGGTVVFLALAVLELLSDKVPGVDHALHVLHFATKPLAAALIVGSALPGDVPGALVASAAGFGALNAVGVHAGMAAIRGGSTTLTLGMANPVLSFVEDVVTGTLFAVAFALPFVGATLALAVTVAIAGLGYVAYRTLKNRVVAPATAANGSAYATSPGNGYARPAAPSYARPAGSSSSRPAAPGTARVVAADPRPEYRR